MKLKRLSNLLAIPTIICFILLALWGGKIIQFNVFLFFALIIFVVVGFITSQIQSERNYTKAIADGAIAEYKKKNNITD